MHAIGLRLTPEQLKMLFDEYDTDGNGTIDFNEFTHMVKRFLKKSWYEPSRSCCISKLNSNLPLSTQGTNRMQLNAHSEEEACKACDETGGSNQAHIVYSDRWGGTTEDWNPAAISVQKWVKSALTRRDQTDLHRSHVPPPPCSPL